jgi:UDP-N-acetylmuramoyl-tripeptide--D-alanyl-D-alanine ligase
VSWYYALLEGLSWIVVAVMLRHALYRGRYLLHIFQQKGYKFNEFSAWLVRNWNSVLLPVPNLALILLVLVTLYYLEPLFTTSSIAVVLFIFAVYWFGSVSEFGIKEVKKPLVFTPRVIRLTVVNVVLAAWIPLLGTALSFYRGTLFPDMYTLLIAWAFAGLLLPYLLLLAALIVHPLEKFIQYRFKIKARRKIASMPNLKVIAVTGSYGKTSTKFLLDSVLKERFRVCTTPGSYNTPMGICKVINNDLQTGDQVLILEMGARYAGNIDELCRIARPDIAVVTNVGLAHLESFGSVDVIAHTKGALIRHLPPGGVAVLNGDDPRVRAMADRNDISVIHTGLSETGNHIRAGEISYDENGCSFVMHADPAGGGAGSTGKSSIEISGSGRSVAGQSAPARPEALPELQWDGGTERITMALLGRHSVENALLAAAAGLAMGLRLPTIRVALQKARPVAHRLELKKRNGVLVIDDAFNSNPVGARNAVSVLSEFRAGKKYVVTPGMIELGDRQDEENRNFGRYMAENPPDHVFLVGEKQTRPVYEGLQDGGYPAEAVTVVASLFEANELLRQRLADGDVVLYENDLPDSYTER